MGKDVYLVMVTRDDTDISRVRHVCTDLGDAREKSLAVPMSEGVSRVEKMTLEEPRAIAPYRVWVRFAENGPEFEAHIRSSIPMQKDVFEPNEPQAKFHGQITVDAESEEQAVAKAKNILFAYLTGGPVAQAARAVPRR